LKIAFRIAFFYLLITSSIVFFLMYTAVNLTQSGIINSQREYLMNKLEKYVQQQVHGPSSVQRMGMGKMGKAMGQFMRMNSFYDVYIYDLDLNEIIQDPFGFDKLPDVGVTFLGNFVILVEKYQGLNHKLLGGIDITASYRFIQKMKSNMLLLSLVGIALSSLAGFIIAFYSIKPLKKINSQINEINVSNLRKRMPVSKRKDEITTLSLTINNMLERLEKGYKLQEQFISDVSHELRTPLTALKGFIRLLERWGKDDEKLRDESIQSMKDTVDEMTNLIESLLLLSKIPKIEEFEEVDLCQIAYDRKEYFEKLYSDFSIEVEVEKTPCIVKSSAKHIKLILNALVDNAVKYSRDKKIVKILVNSDRICVKDYGVGIPKNELTKIFERFYMIDRSRSGSKDGRKSHGLGLSIVKKAADLIEAKISVESEENKGSKFCLIFQNNL